MIHIQAQGLQRALNVSRMISETHDQASLYIPLSVPTNDLPHYINMDEYSPWHTGALLSTVVETMTLPSRLRECRPRRGYMNDMDGTLNANGNQRIAECQCSIVDPQAWEPNGTPLTGAASDARISSADSSRRMLDQEDMHEATSHLDMDFLQASMSSRRQGPTREHVFAQIGSLRGYLEESDLSDNEDACEARKRRRLASLPVIEKLVPFVQFYLPHRRKATAAFACFNADRHI